MEFNYADHRPPFQVHADTLLEALDLIDTIDRHEDVEDYAQLTLAENEINVTLADENNYSILNVVIENRGDDNFIPQGVKREYWINTTDLRYILKNTFTGEDIVEMFFEGDDVILKSGDQVTSVDEETDITEEMDQEAIHTNPFPQYERLSGYDTFMLKIGLKEFKNFLTDTLNNGYTHLSVNVYPRNKKYYPGLALLAFYFSKSMGFKLEDQLIIPKKDWKSLEVPDRWYINTLNLRKLGMDDFVKVLHPEKSPVDHLNIAVFDNYHPLRIDYKIDDHATAKLMVSPDGKPGELIEQTNKALREARSKRGLDDVDPSWRDDKGQLRLGEHYDDRKDEIDMERARKLHRMLNEGRDEGEKIPWGHSFSMVKRFRHVTEDYPDMKWDFQAVDWDRIRGEDFTLNERREKLEEVLGVPTRLAKEDFKVYRKSEISDYEQQAEEYNRQMKELEEKLEQTYEYYKKEMNHLGREPEDFAEYQQEYESFEARIEKMFNNAENLNQKEAVLNRMRYVYPNLMHHYDTVIGPYKEGENVLEDKLEKRWDKLEDDQEQDYFFANTEKEILAWRDAWNEYSEDQIQKWIDEGQRDAERKLDQGELIGRKEEKFTEGVEPTFYAKGWNKAITQYTRESKSDLRVEDLSEDEIEQVYQKLVRLMTTGKTQIGPPPYVSTKFIESNIGEIYDYSKSDWDVGNINGFIETDPKVKENVLNWAKDDYPYLYVRATEVLEEEEVEEDNLIVDEVTKVRHNEYGPGMVYSYVQSDERRRYEVNFPQLHTDKQDTTRVWSDATELELVERIDDKDKGMQEWYSKWKEGKYPIEEGEAEKPALSHWSNMYTPTNQHGRLPPALYAYMESGDWLADAKENLDYAFYNRVKLGTEVPLGYKVCENFDLVLVRSDEEPFTSIYKLSEFLDQSEKETAEVLIEEPDVSEITDTVKRYLKEKKNIRADPDLIEREADHLLEEAEGYEVEEEAEEEQVERGPPEETGYEDFRLKHCLEHPYPLREWQVEALDIYLKAKRGIIEAIPGTGKTTVAWEVINQLKCPKTLIVVPNLHLIHQHRNDLVDRGAAELDVGAYYSDEKNVRHYTFTTYLSLQVKPDLIDRHDLIVLDEVHHLKGPKTYEKLMPKLREKEWVLGLSATPPREDEGEEAQGVLENLPILYKLDIKQAEERGLVAPRKVHEHATVLTKEEQEKYDEYMAIMRKAIGILGTSNPVVVKRRMGKSAALSKAGNMFFKGLTGRNNVLASATKKFDEVVEIVKNNPDEKIMLFTLRVPALENTIERLNEAGLPAKGITGSVPTKERVKIFEHWGETFQILGSIKTLGEGVDVPEVSVAIVVASGQSDRTNLQKLGRIIRPYPDKTAHAHVVFARGTVEEKITGMIKDVLYVGEIREETEEDVGGPQLERVDEEEPEMLPEKPPMGEWYNLYETDDDEVTPEQRKWFRENFDTKNEDHAFYVDGDIGGYIGTDLPLDYETCEELGINLERSNSEPFLDLELISEYADKPVDRIAGKLRSIGKRGKKDYFKVVDAILREDKGVRATLDLIRREVDNLRKLAKERGPETTVGKVREKVEQAKEVPEPEPAPPGVEDLPETQKMQYDRGYNEAMEYLQAGDEIQQRELDPQFRGKSGTAYDMGWNKAVTDETGAEPITPVKEEKEEVIKEKEQEFEPADKMVVESMRDKMKGIDTEELCNQVEAVDDIEPLKDIPKDFDTYEEFEEKISLDRSRPYSRISAVLGYGEPVDTVADACKGTKEGIPAEVIGYVNEHVNCAKDTVMVYRGGGNIKAGDWIALEYEVAIDEGKPVYCSRVPLTDVVWAGTVETEWYYVPKALQEKYKNYDSSDFYEEYKEGKEMEEPEVVEEEAVPEVPKQVAQVEEEAEEDEEWTVEQDIEALENEVEDMLDGRVSVEIEMDENDLYLIPTINAGYEKLFFDTPSTVYRGIDNLSEDEKMQVMGEAIEEFVNEVRDAMGKEPKDLYQKEVDLPGRGVIPIRPEEEIEKMAEELQVERQTIEGGKEFLKRMIESGNRLLMNPYDNAIIEVIGLEEDKNMMRAQIDKWDLGAQHDVMAQEPSFQQNFPPEVIEDLTGFQFYLPPGKNDDLKASGYDIKRILNGLKDELIIATRSATTGVKPKFE